MEKINKLIKKYGKEETARKLLITVRYVELISQGKKKPSSRLEKLIDLCLQWG